MDNEEIVKIGEVELHFKLKSQTIVELESLFGKNIFEIFEDLSFTNVRTILSKCLISPEKMDANELMDMILQKYTLIEIASVLLKEIAVKSGLLRKENVEETSDKEIKNA